MIPEKAIARVVRQFHAVHKIVMAMYVSRLFNISRDMAENTIHKAMLAHQCVEKGDYICESQFIDPDSSHMQMSRAIRVALEFMKLGEEDFFERRVLPSVDCRALLYVMQPPTAEAKEKNAAASTQLIEISYIMRGSEVASSVLESKFPVPSHLRNSIRRIAIVEPGFRQDYIVKAGYAMFIRFGKGMFTFVTTDVFTTAPETRWDDVPEEV